MSQALPFGEVADRARRAAAQALPKGLAAAARAALAVAEAALADVARDPSVKDKLAGLACRAGCNSCCYQVVGITPAEAALLAEGLAKLGARRRGQVRARTEEVAARGRGFDLRQWWTARLPCPLLAADGKCAVHANRPLPCRAFTSADADLCRRSLEGETVRIPVLAAQWAIYGHAQAGLAQALATAGTDPGPLPLVDVLTRMD